MRQLETDSFINNVVSNMKQSSFYLFSFFLIWFVFPLPGTVSATIAEEKSIIIAHRGASGYRPEHTLMAYELAIEQGADYIEPDLVMTKDGHFVARHDVYLSTTTNVADVPEFAYKKRILQGHDDWFVFDFTLAELKKLKAIQPWQNRQSTYDGVETIPTLKEILNLVEKYKAKGKEVGLYIELKRPADFAKMFPDLATQMATHLQHVLDRNISLYFQCFDGDFLLELYPLTSAPLVYLVAGEAINGSMAYQLTEDLERYHGKVDGYGLNKALLLNVDGTPSSIISDLHSKGKVVHVWTVRDDKTPKMFQNVQQELKYLLNAGVDGIFTDFPDTALSARDSMRLLKGKL